MSIVYTTAQRSAVGSHTLTSFCMFKGVVASNNCLSVSYYCPNLFFYLEYQRKLSYACKIGTGNWRRGTIIKAAARVFIQRQKKVSFSPILERIDNKLDDTFLSKATFSC